MDLLKTLFLLIIVLLLSLPISSCGGSSESNSSGGGSSNIQIDNNACDIIPGSSTRVSNDRAANLNTKIFTGTLCGNVGSPFVRIIVEGPENTGSLCSGTLLSSEYVVTAGHCLARAFLGFNVLPRDVVVQGASGDNTPWSSRALSFRINPRFALANSSEIPQGGISPSQLVNDIAVIRLASSVENFSSSPVLLSRSPNVGNVISIFGYGSTESGDFGDLRSGEMLLSSIDENLLGAEYLDGLGSNTCTGDSGGPALIETSDGSGRYGIVGITSFGINESCEPGDITFFTNLQSQSNLDFLNSFVPDLQVL